MPCKNLQPFVIPYLRGDTDCRREIVERHLQSCRQCRREVRDFDEILGLMNEVEAFTPAPEFFRELSAKMASERCRSATSSQGPTLLEYLHYRLCCAPGRLALLALLLLLFLWWPFVYLQMFAFPQNVPDSDQLPVWQMPLEKDL